MNGTSIAHAAKRVEKIREQIGNIKKMEIPRARSGFSAAKDRFEFELPSEDSDSRYEFPVILPLTVNEASV